PFTPSAVHQSSCCMNVANYARCPYYRALAGQAQRQPVVRSQRRSSVERFGQQLRRIFSFNRDERQRRRVYFS
ncbi:MAG: hypothetical protein KDE31_32380, partial [Caldilineaceae bacterium]|nr:hypothetical protein [Caldilineaceae bacterium]